MAPVRTDRFQAQGHGSVSQGLLALRPRHQSHRSRAFHLVAHPPGSLVSRPRRCPSPFRPALTLLVRNSKRSNCHRPGRQALDSALSRVRARGTRRQDLQPLSCAASGATGGAGWPARLFYAGDDLAAKAHVRTLLEAAGYFPVDLGPLDVGGPLLSLPSGSLSAASFITT